MRPKLEPAERAIARIAQRSQGVVTRRELLGTGVTESEIKHRVRIGLLIPEHRGVYRVGHRAPSVEAHYLAAVRACGNGAALYGKPAAYVHGLLKGPAPPSEVIAPRPRTLRGVKTHRCRNLDARDVTTVRRIPVTSVARTLVDIAADLTLEALARACHEAGVRYRTTPNHVNAVLARRPNSPGATKLRDVMSGAVPVSLSHLERAFIALLRKEGLPLPRTNRLDGERRVDCYWPEQKLVVELDSYRFHNSRYAWEQERHREREARSRGNEFRRYTYGDVLEDPRLMLAELRPLLTVRTPS